MALSTQAPEPQAVNQFVWELINYRNMFTHKWVVVHCTHGFNRTGALSGPVPFFCYKKPVPLHCTDPRRGLSEKLSDWQFLRWPCLTKQGKLHGRHLTPLQQL